MDIAMETTSGVELGNTSAAGGLADVLSKVVRDPGVKDAVENAARSVGGAFADAWRRNDGNRALLSTVQRIVRQVRR